MKRWTKILTTILAAASLLLLIMDTKTATAGAAAGVKFCIEVIIPSLFPFFILTTYLNASLSGFNIPGLRLLGKLLHIPSGTESILLLGLIGGYPVGAQLITDAYANKQLGERNSKIMLGYCSNAGPAFIFGVAGALFSSAKVSFILWGIHILSALVTGLLLPRPDKALRFHRRTVEISIVDALKKSISICASVCGWIVLFKIIMTYLEHWLKEPKMLIFLSGFLELSNGCILLSRLSSEPARFILCSAFLSFGGVCVLMQTASVTKPLGLGLYIPGKIIQTAVSILMSSIIAFILFPEAKPVPQSLVSYVLLCFLLFIPAKIYAEKICGNSEKNNV